MTSGGMMFSKGDVVVIQFPFSDLMNAKKRPMLVMGEKGEDIIGCAITSNPTAEGISLTEFIEGGLAFPSKVKYWQIHTFLKSLAERKIARISKKNYLEIVGKIDKLIGS